MRRGATPAIRYTMAVLVVGLALALALPFREQLEPGVVALFLAAVTISALYGGAGPALLATALSLVVTYHFFLAPLYLLALDESGVFRIVTFRLALFLIAALLVIVLAATRNRAEDRLRRSQRELADFVDHAAVGMHWVDKDDRIVWANQTELDMLGYTRAEYIGQSIATFHADQDVVDGILERLARHETLHDCEARLRCKDGTIKHVLISSDVLWEDGRFVQTRCVTRDVTALKLAGEERARAHAREHEARAFAEAAEERYRDLVDGLEAIVWEADPRNFQLTFVSRWAETLFGHPLERWVSEPDFWLGLIRPEDRGAAERLRRTAIDEGRDGGVEYRAVTADGRVIWMHHIAYVAHGADGRPSRLRGLMVDITERKRAEKEHVRLLERAENARAEAEAANRAKDEFLATLGHEIRNPLAAVRAAIETMRLRHASEASVQQVGALVERQVGHVSLLLDDLLDLFRVSRGKVKLRKTEVDLASVIKRSVEQVQAREHDLALSLPSAPITLRADATRLEQVFTNLLNNAVKYTPAGGKIRLTAETQRGEAIVRVKDTGVGIAPDFLPRIFEPFTQSDRALAHQAEGLGIGLALVQRLLEMHGGTIEARSDGPGKGSEFVVHLPVQPAPSARASARNIQEPLVEASSCKVLIVDDNIDHAQQLAELFRIWGHDVRVADGSSAALETATTFRPQVVILDIGLPDVDGYELARRLRSQSAEPMVLVALTGFGQWEYRRRSSEVGIDHHLVKPADLGVLRDILASAGCPSDAGAAEVAGSARIQVPTSG